MGEIKIHAEKTDLGFWSYIQRSPGELPETPLHTILKWILEQLNLANFEAEHDESGNVVSLTLGRDAPGYSSREDAIEEARRRLLAVNISGLVAQARESGIPPGHAHIPKMVTQSITDSGRRNTEFHYAFELIRVLGRLNKKTFNLEAPPISGVAPDSVVSYLRESTRCWLYGFHGASVALSRACLEDALKVRLPRASHQQELVHLISAAKHYGVLDDCMVELAHSLRKAGNKFLHGKTITEQDSRESLDALRGIVEHLFAD